MFMIKPEGPSHTDQIETLLDEAFGPGRYARTAYRIRESLDPAEGLSFIILSGQAPGALVGSIRFFPVRIGQTSALLLGPLVIRPSASGQGAGMQLIAHGLEAAHRQGHRLVILVGDAPYYARAGFAPVSPGTITLPGPVDPARLLYRELEPGAFNGVKGEVRAQH